MHPDVLCLLRALKDRGLILEEGCLRCQFVLRAVGSLGAFCLRFQGIETALHCFVSKRRVSLGRH